MSKRTITPEVAPMSPYLIVKDAPRAIAFYQKAFGATELFRLCEPSGKVGHAELRIGRAYFMLADEYPDFGAQSPVTLGGTPVSIQMYVDDVDVVVSRAVEAGATVLRPAVDEFYGDRVALIADPMGHKWHLATHKEDVTPEEMQRRMNEAYGSG